MQIKLIPKGKPELFCQWHDRKPRIIEVERITGVSWFGKPIDNPKCGILEYPKFAWRRIRL